MRAKAVPLMGSTGQGRGRGGRRGGHGSQRAGLQPAFNGRPRNEIQRPANHWKVGDIVDEMDGKLKDHRIGDSKENCDEELKSTAEKDEIQRQDRPECEVTVKVTAAKATAQKLASLLAEHRGGKIIQQPAVEPAEDVRKDILPTDTDKSHMHRRNNANGAPVIVQHHVHNSRITTDETAPAALNAHWTHEYRHHEKDSDSKVKRYYKEGSISTWYRHLRPIGTDMYGGIVKPIRFIWMREFLSYLS